MNHKHTRIIALLLGAGLLGLSGIASAGIVDTKHNLGSGSTAGNNMVSDTADTCVFCHTPHKGAGTTVPLWNKGLTSSASYTAYSSTTMDGTTNFTGSTSMACLSCHDGTQAMDNIVNAPGSGGYTAGGLDQTYTWNVGGTVDTSGKLIAGALTNIGDGSGALGDDHPVAIPYGGGGVTVAAPTGATTDPDFVQVGAGLNQAVIGGEQKWWFDTANAGRMDSNEIRLYTANNQAQVECASCHDPHSSVNPTFLRIANTNSAVCTACHVK